MRVPVTVISVAASVALSALSDSSSCAKAGALQSIATASAAVDTIGVDLDMVFPFFCIFFA